MSVPCVSVIIPAYNAEKTIEETLLSVLQQTYQDIEIIVVDDGSTDNTADIVKRYTVQHPHIHYIYQGNAGVAAARNTAIEVSKGTYIAPIDADDLWHTQRLELHVTALENANENTALAYSPFYILNKQSEIVGQSQKLNFSGRVFEEELKRNLVGNGSGILVKKDVLLDIGGYSPHLRELGAQGCEDYLVQLKIAYKYEYVCVPYYLIGYRVYHGNMSSDEIRMIRSRLHVFDYMKAHYDLDIKALRRVKMKFLSELIFYTREKKGIYSALRQISPFIQDFPEITKFICIILRGVLYRVCKRMIVLCNIRMSSDSQDNIKEEKRSFQDIAQLQPE